MEGEGKKSNMQIMFIFVKKIVVRRATYVTYRLPFLKKFRKSTAKSRRQIFTSNLKTQNVFHDQTI